MVVFVLANVSRDTLNWDPQMVSLLERQALHSSNPLRLYVFQVCDVKNLETPGSSAFILFAQEKRKEPTYVLKVLSCACVG